MPDTERATPPEKPPTSRWQHLRDRTSRAAHRVRVHAGRANRWARSQPRQRWVELAIGTAMLAVALLLLIGVVTSVISWFSPEPPPPPPAPPQPPPRWLAEVHHVGLWRGIGHALQSYAAENASAAGMPPSILLATWTAIGGFLLLGSWFARKRFGLATLAWCAWTAATAWVLWTYTPGGSPVPAVLTAALSVTAAVVPVSTPVIAAFVVLGAVPTLT